MKNEFFVLFASVLKTLTLILTLGTEYKKDERRRWRLTLFYIYDIIVLLSLLLLFFFSVLKVHHLYFNTVRVILFSVFSYNHWWWWRWTLYHRCRHKDYILEIKWKKEELNQLYIIVVVFFWYIDMLACLLRIMLLIRFLISFSSPIYSLKNFNFFLNFVLFAIKHN